MTLPSPDANEIGRYDETIAIPSSGSGGFSSVLNRALLSISAAFTKFVRTQSVFRRAPATIASSTSYAAIALSTTVTNHANFTHAAGVFTCNEAGEYRIKLNGSFEGNATGIRGVRLVGSGVLGTRQQTVNAAGTLDNCIGVEWIVTLAVAETVTAQALQSSGGPLLVTADVTFERVL